MPRMPSARAVARAVLFVALGALSVSACGFGVTLPVGGVADTGAQLRGVVRNTKAETTEYWYQYGPTTAYGSSTPYRTVSISSPPNGGIGDAWLPGLAEHPTYN